MLLARAAPAVGPYPGNTATTPEGNPTSLHKAAMYRAVRGVCSAGFPMNTFPQARIGAKRF